VALVSIATLASGSAVALCIASHHGHSLAPGAGEGSAVATNASRSCSTFERSIYGSETEHRNRMSSASRSDALHLDVSSLLINRTACGVILIVGLISVQTL
jgi:hypothetical protein